MKPSATSPVLLALAALLMSACAAPTPPSASASAVPPAASTASAALHPAVKELAEAQRPVYLDTLRDLVNVESGSRDLEGLGKLAALIQTRLTALGMSTQLIDPSQEMIPLNDAPAKVGPMVHGELTGTGHARILLIAHMDTVYLKGMLKDQPFRVDGNRAYGLGVADDKQGVALVIHTVAMLQKLGVKDYGKLSVLINGDEEISSPGSRRAIVRMAAEHDAVLSYEGGGPNGEVRLATSGIGSAYLTVKGRASHAGAAPERGVNALTELSHQILQLSNLSKPEQGLKLNWTVAKAGTNRNVIPAEASAQADARALRVADFDGLEAELTQRVKTQLVRAAKFELKFGVRRPPLEARPASLALANNARGIYQELGMAMPILDTATGGGTDAAFAFAGTKGAVIEGMGLSGFGSHSNDAEYVLIDTIVPRLYLSTRLIMETARGTGK